MVITPIRLGRGLLVSAENQSGSGNYNRDGGRLLGLVDIPIGVKGDRRE
jgi:hypothetical protein